MRGALAGILAVAGWLLAAGPALAACPPAAQFGEWTMRTSASVGITADNGLDDVATPMYTHGFGAQWEPGPGVDCSFESGGRVAVYPYRPATSDPSVEVAQKVYIPGSGPRFVRMLTLVRNASGQRRTFTLWSGFQTDFGASTRVVGTSSGDRAGTAGDDWLAVFDGASGQPSAAMWHGNDTRYRQREAAVLDADQALPSRPVVDGVDDFQVRWDLDLAPGEKKVVMQLGVPQSTDGIVGALGVGPEELFARIDDDDARAIVNWVIPDADRDGVENGLPDHPVDNCMYAGNLDQADVDKDGAGDVCDDDMDGDGLTNAEEALRGTDGRRGDTDGDGRPDPADLCPAVAGTGADGCPVAARPRDTTPPKFRMRGLGTKMKLRTFRRSGVRCRASANEPIALTCRLVAKVKGRAKLAAAGELELASGRTRLGGGMRSVTLKPKARWVRGKRRFTVYLLATATDGSGNRATIRRKVAIRP